MPEQASRFDVGVTHRGGAFWEGGRQVGLFPALTAKTDDNEETSVDFISHLRYV